MTNIRDTDNYRERHRERQARHRAKNPDLVKARRKRHYEDNKYAYIARAKMRHEHVARATPNWLTSKQLAEIMEIYEEARRITAETGALHVVDHIWPLRGKNSCGLHVPWNLQIVTSAENDSKGNKEPI